MRRKLTLLGIGAVLALALVGAASATPGNGKNTVFIFNDCDNGVGEITLVSQASLAGLFATAHVVGSNHPAPLVSLAYEVYVGATLIDSGAYAHANPQRGQPLVTCDGSFDVDGLTFVIRVVGFFPAGS
jgi:hypothetical protein